MRPLDHAGKTFGRLTAIKFTGRSDKFNQRLWLCRCSCGNEVEIPARALKSGNTMSCGCYKSDRIRETQRKHGMCRTAIYRIWCLMRSRCRNPDSQDYANYGGRGITVCDRWYDSFEAFRDDVGERPSANHSLDRIDVSRGYEPGNVRWADQKTQCNNKRSNVVIEFEGERLTIAQWAERIGVDQRLIAQRLRAGMPTAHVLDVNGRRRALGIGERDGSERGTWHSMLHRCNNPKSPAYPRYGGRGISVCDRWQGADGFAHFLADMGPRPAGHFLDRTDVNGNYEPANCSWVPMKQSARNTRRSRHLTLDGQTRCVSEWAEKLGIPAWKISQRLARGWSVERALDASR